MLLCRQKSICIKGFQLWRTKQTVTNSFSGHYKSVGASRLLPMLCQWSITFFDAHGRPIIDWVTRSTLWWNQRPYVTFITIVSKKKPHSTLSHCAATLYSASFFYSDGRTIASIDSRHAEEEQKGKRRKMKGKKEKKKRRIRVRSILARFSPRGKGMPLTGEVIGLLMIRFSVSSVTVSVSFRRPEFECRVLVLIAANVSAFPPMSTTSSLFLFTHVISFFFIVHHFIDRERVAVQERISLNVTAASLRV